MNERELKRVLEVVLLCAERPVEVDELAEIVSMDASVGGQTPQGEERVSLRVEIRAALASLGADCAERGVELAEVSSGFRYQVKPSFAHWIARLRAERPSRYSRALLETLALIAYRQPITRGEIEDIRGVGVSQSIMKTLHEREWVRVLGHREVPGRPAMYGTTRNFLDDFSLKRLEELPPLAEIRDLESIHADLFDDLLAEPPSAQIAEGGPPSEPGSTEPEIVAVEGDVPRSDVPYDEEEDTALDELESAPLVDPLEDDGAPEPQARRAEPGGAEGE